MSCGLCLYFLAYNIFQRKKNITYTLQLSISFFRHDPLLCFRVKMIFLLFLHRAFDVTDVTKSKVIYIYILYLENAMHYEKCLHFFFYYYLFVQNENTFNMYTFFENKIQN